MNDLRSKQKTLLSQLMHERTITLSLTVVLVIIVCGAIWPRNFLTVSNFRSLLINASIKAIVAVGMMNLLIAGYIDLSVGALLAMSGGLVAKAIVHWHMNPLVAVIITIAVVLAIGAINGVMVSVLKINPMIQTLAMQYICSGLALILAGSTISGLPRSFTWIGQNQFLGLQMPVWIMILIVLVMSFLNQRSPFFRQNYYIGGNEKAAVLSGIKVKKMIIFNYMLIALLAGLAGILTCARLGAASSNAGTSLEMKCISAAILGGASITGGEGRVIGALVGILFMGILDNIIVIAGIPVEWNQAVTGIVLIAVVTMDILLKKNK